MARFKSNQEVVCVRADWVDIDTKKDAPYGPKKDELITVEHYSPVLSEFCCFVEYPALDENGERHFYHERNFEPVVSTAALQELFQQEPAFV